MDKQYSFDYESYDSLSELNEQDMELVRRAKEACYTAYAPYSDFKVGAAARLASGRIVTGSNQENDVFPAGICAESNLMHHCMSNHKDDKVISMAVTSVPADKECYPCGICRQIISNAEDRQGTPIRVIMAGRDSATVIDTSKKLLPFVFKL